MSNEGAQRTGNGYKSLEDTCCEGQPFLSHHVLQLLPPAFQSSQSCHDECRGYGEGNRKFVGRQNNDGQEQREGDHKEDQARNKERKEVGELLHVGHLHTGSILHIRH